MRLSSIRHFKVCFTLNTLVHGCLPTWPGLFSGFQSLKPGIEWLIRRLVKTRLRCGRMCSIAACLVYVNMRKGIKIGGIWRAVRVTNGLYHQATTGAQVNLIRGLRRIKAVEVPIPRDQFCPLHAAGLAARVRNVILGDIDGDTHLFSDCPRIGAMREQFHRGQLF